jgi:hypothetical protein
LKFLKAKQKQVIAVLTIAQLFPFLCIHSNSQQIFQLLLPETRSGSIVFGLLMIFEWHLVWASGSGMETILFALGATFVFFLLRKDANSFWTGLSIGLLVTVLPDGITLFGPALFILGINILGKKQRINSLFRILLGLFLPLII